MCWPSRKIGKEPRYAWPIFRCPSLLSLRSRREILDTTYIPRRPNAREHSSTRVARYAAARQKFHHRRRDIERFYGSTRRCTGISLAVVLFLFRSFVQRFLQPSYVGFAERRKRSRKLRGSKASCAPHQSLNRKRSRLVCRPIWRSSTFFLSYPPHRRIATRFSTWPRFPPRWKVAHHRS